MAMLAIQRKDVQEISSAIIIFVRQKIWHVRRTKMARPILWIRQRINVYLTMVVAVAPVMTAPFVLTVITANVRPPVVPVTTALLAPTAITINVHHPIALIAPVMTAQFVLTVITANVRQPVVPVTMELFVQVATTINVHHPVVRYPVARIQTQIILLPERRLTTARALTVTMIKI